MSAKKIKVTTEPWTGRDSEEVEAQIIGPFAVHRSLGGLFPWTTTHIRTGMRVADARTKRQAVSAAKEFIAIKAAKWNDITDREVVASWPKRRIAQCRKIQARAAQ